MELIIIIIRHRAILMGTGHYVIPPIIIKTQN